jgi:phosphoribosyl-ATP pyrophosphohydrolase
MFKILEDLVTLARERKSSPVVGSYTNKLLEDKSLAKEKVLEEINELIEAVEQDTNKIHEAADVLYHLIMYLERNGIKSGASAVLAASIFHYGTYSVNEAKQYLASKDIPVRI